MMQRLSSWATLIGALGIALLAAAVMLGLITNVPRNYLLLFGGVGVVFLGFYIITRPRDANKQASTMRIASQGANVLIAGLAVILIAIGINYVANQQFHQRLDLTANKERTLSPQTISVLQNLQEPVQVTGFFTPQTLSERKQAEDLLKDYTGQSAKLVVQMVDPDANPALAQKYENAVPGTVVFEKGGRTEKVYNYDENTFTNAILKVTQTNQPVVYFITGHNEYKLDDFDTTGLGQIADFLKQVNYKVQPLSLATISGTLPADTSALVIAGPTKPFSAEDEKTVQTYLDAGGRVLVLADPGTSVGLTDTLKAWGLTLDNNLVLDPGSNYRGNLPIPVFLNFPVSPVTENLEGYGVYLPGGRSITKADVEGKDISALLNTSNESCAKSDLQKLQQGTAPACETSDPKGPFVLGYTVEGAGGGGANSDKRGRLVVIGNASFLTNRWMQSQDALGNQQMFSNAVNYLAGQEQLIAIPPRDPNTRALAPLSGGDVNLILWTSAALVPLAALLIGGFLWWRRR